MKIGIVGQGFVGTAVKEGLKDYHTIDTFDLDEEKRDVDYIEDIIDRNSIIFVCLPTPENTILLGSAPTLKTRTNSPPETISKPAPKSHKRFKIARFEFALTA